MRVALLPVARSTFDVAFAEEKLRSMLARLELGGYELVGPRRLLLHPQDGQSAISQLDEISFDAVLLLQITFTDAAFVLQVAQRWPVPLAIWAPKEARTGGRLRLNAFCGLNLASHALGRSRRAFDWLLADPDEASIDTGLKDLLERVHQRTAADAVHEDGIPSVAVPSVDADKRRVEGRSAQSLDEDARLGPRQSPLAHTRVLRIGEPPVGFDTCLHDAAEMLERFGVELEALPLNTLFATALKVEDGSVQRLKQQIAARVQALESVNTVELERSLRLKLALDELKRTHRVDAFAVRCWPEMFTDYGGAVCGPLAMLGEARTPCACEADVYGALTQLALQRTADAPVFLVDLVDVDVADDTAVVWHCGQAPLSMAAGRVAATVHSNRRMPLLYEFGLKPGRVTFCRVSQARGRHTLVVAAGEMLDRPMAFSGTSGVLRFDASARRVLDRLIDCGLEHHMALVYGDYIPQLYTLADSLSLPLIDLTVSGEKSGD